MPSVDGKKFRLLYGAVTLIGIALVVYSQTLSFTWDEGFHLVAEQLINAGKKPYVDFLFAHGVQDVGQHRHEEGLRGQG